MSAVQQLLTDHIDIWTAADTAKKSGRGRASGNAGSVYGIKKLRELILELAVRGKLVSQDANDEPASALLKRIQSEKAKLIAEGKIRKDKPLLPITEDEKPFDLPQGWEWANLPDVSDYKVGKTPSTKSNAYWTNSDDGFDWVSIADLNHDGTVFETNRHITAKAVSEVFRSDPAPAGTILMSFKLTLGKTSILDKPAFHNEAIISIYPYQGIFKDFLFKVLPARAMAGDSKSAIKGNTLNSESIAALMIPVPPLPEQIRIVAKVDELMVLCDQLETRHNNAAEAHEKLVSHLLGTLTNTPVRPINLVVGHPPEPVKGCGSTGSPRTEFEENWQRIGTHFDTLFTTEASIDALKQTLLQLAVMGKLVPQNPNDLPASDLLNRYKISSTASSIVGWSTVSLGNLGDIYGGATPSKSKSEYWVGTIPWISPKDMKRFYIGDAEDKVSEGAILETALKLIPAGSLLMVVRGMILAHSFPVALTTSEVTINQDMKALVVPEEIKDYLLLCMRAMKNSFVSLVDRSSHGTCKLISEKLWTAMVAIPPLAEQHRIVAKVVELMALCDQLKTHLADARQLQQKLADVLVEQAAS